MLCLALAISACVIEDELFVYAENLTDETIRVFWVNTMVQNQAARATCPPAPSGIRDTAETIV